MIKKVNKNKFGVIEYSITNEEDLKDLPKGDSDNSVYAVDDDNKVYLYSKKANDYILINGGGANPNEVSIKIIDMGDSSVEIDFELFSESGYYCVRGTIEDYELLNSIVYLDRQAKSMCFTLYEYCIYIFYIEDDDGGIWFNGSELFEPLKSIGDLEELPSNLQPCSSLVDAITKLYIYMTES